MRSVQLKQVIGAHLPENIDLGVIAYEPRHRTQFWLWLARQKPAIFIILKNAAYAMPPEVLDWLRAKAIAVGVDHIDGDLSRIDLAPYDFHISASHAGQSALHAIPSLSRAYSGCLLHHADPRLARLSFAATPAFQALYLGLPENALLPDSLSPEVSVMPIRTTSDMQSHLPRLPQFNFHFAVRPTSDAQTLLRAYKPFTKGFTAASCHSNILINRDVDDAVHFLGEDYPYLVASPALADVIAGFERAREGFGSPEWLAALDRMRAMQAAVSPKALARQFQTIIEAVS